MTAATIPPSAGAEIPSGSIASARSTQAAARFAIRRSVAGLIEDVQPSSVRSPGSPTWVNPQNWAAAIAFFRHRPRPSAAGLEKRHQIGEVAGIELLVEPGRHHRDRALADLLDLATGNACLLVGAG